MKDLFTPATRDERQEESVRKWLQSKGKGTLECCTGYGFNKAVTPVIVTITKGALFIFKINFTCV